MNDNSNDETNFPLNLLSTDTQVLRFLKIFANDSSPSTKLWKTQLSKMVQLGGFITSILPFLTISGKLVKPIPDSFTEDLAKQDLILSVNKYYFQI